MRKEKVGNKRIVKLREYIKDNSCSAEELEVRFSKSPVLYQGYLSLSGEWKRRFQEYMSGVKTLPLTYDPFFKKMFSPEIHSERLSDFISSILGEKVKVKCMLPNENRIVNEASLLIMDMLVEMENGSLVNIEIQKVPYTFPGERITCYLADSMTRQYAKVKTEKGNYFTYKDINKVVTIVIYENSPAICKSEKLKGEYIHRGKMKFDTGLEMEMYQECYIIALDEFKKSRYYLGNKSENGIEKEINNVESKLLKGRTDINGWLSLLVTDDVEKIEKNIEKYPWLEEIYVEMAEYLIKPEEVLNMYSEALKILDENTVKYMVDEFQGEIKELKEKNTELNGKNTKLEKNNIELKGKNTKLEKNNIELKGKNTKLEENNKKLKDKIIDFERKQLEADVNIIMNMKNNGFTIEQVVIATGKTEDEIKRAIEKN